MNFNHLIQTAQQAKPVAELISQGWSIYRDMKGDGKQKELLAQLQEVQRELEMLKVHASVKEAAEIEAIGKVISGLPQSSSANLLHEQRKVAADREAQRLRSLLVADMHNVQLRRLYLAARTPEQMEQDRKAGRSSGSRKILACIIGGLFIGFMIGALIGREMEPKYLLGIKDGIRIGSKVKSVNWAWPVILAAVGGAIGWAMKPSIDARHENLGADVVPIPEDMGFRSAGKIRRILFKEK